MSIERILLLAALSFCLGQLKPLEFRKSLLLILSLLTYFWLQPASPIRYLDYWLPSLSILLVFMVWLLIKIRFHEGLSLKGQDFALLFIPLLVVSLVRYLPICCITPTYPPPLSQITLLFLFILFLAGLITRSKDRIFFPLFLIAFLIVLFILQKIPTLALLTAQALRRLTAQDIQFSSALDIQWLGYSFLAFRLLHVLLDLRANRLEPVSLKDFSLYALFFPTLPAGPIARLPHFQKHIHSPSSTQVWEGAKRLLMGLFRKFVVADSLALLSLSPQNATQIHSGTYLWIALLAYSLRLYFDFSGYTDIAIGMGRLAGIILPENFTSPYTQTSLIKFWNSWHITLADWFRAYIFNPLTRKLRTSQRLPTWMIILSGQSLVMLLIGIWHGITPNFAVWGLWHALGLFINNRWNELEKRLGNSLVPPLIAAPLGWIVTFSYVTLGWVWFLMPDLPTALQLYQRLFFGLP